MPKQSLYENDRRELRADYLARLADAKVDVVYILTGQRMEGAWLSAGASELLNAYVCLPEDLQRVLLSLSSGLRAHVLHGGSRTLHAPSTPYRPGDAP